MEWGMKNRLSQLIQKDGKALFLPIDHGYFQGPTHSLEKPGETIKPLWQYADALMLTRGVLRNCIDPTLPKPYIMRVSGAVSVIGDMTNESIVTSVREVIRLNASAVSMSVFVGTAGENKSLTNLWKLVDECEDYGIPVMAVTSVGKELEKRSPIPILGRKNLCRNWCPRSQNLLLQREVRKSCRRLPRTSSHCRRTKNRNTTRSIRLCLRWHTKRSNRR